MRGATHGYITEVADGMIKVDVSSSTGIDGDTRTVEERFLADHGSLGWFITCHKSQGMTVDKCIVSSLDEMNYNMSLVALSRARENTSVFLRSRKVTEEHLDEATGEVTTRERFERLGEVLSRVSSKLRPTYVPANGMEQMAYENEVHLAAMLGEKKLLALRGAWHTLEVDPATLIGTPESVDRCIATVADIKNNIADTKDELIHAYDPDEGIVTNSEIIDSISDRLVELKEDLEVAETNLAFYESGMWVKNAYSMAEGLFGEVSHSYVSRQLQVIDDALQLIEDGVVIEVDDAKKMISALNILNSDSSMRVIYSGLGMEFNAPDPSQFDISGTKLKELTKEAEFNAVDKQLFDLSLATVLKAKASGRDPGEDLRIVLKNVEDIKFGDTSPAMQKLLGLGAQSAKQHGDTDLDIFDSVLVGLAEASVWARSNGVPIKISELHPELDTSEETAANKDVVPDDYVPADIEFGYPEEYYEEDYEENYEDVEQIDNAFDAFSYLDYEKLKIRLDALVIMDRDSDNKIHMLPRSSNRNSSNNELFDLDLGDIQTVSRILSQEIVYPTDLANVNKLLLRCEVDRGLVDSRVWDRFNHDLADSAEKFMYMVNTRNPIVEGAKSKQKYSDEEKIALAKQHRNDVAYRTDRTSLNVKTLVDDAFSLFSETVNASGRFVISDVTHFNADEGVALSGLMPLSGFVEGVSQIYRYKSQDRTPPLLGIIQTSDYAFPGTGAEQAIDAIGKMIYGSQYSVIKEQAKDFDYGSARSPSSGPSAGTSSGLGKNL